MIQKLLGSSQYCKKGRRNLNLLVKTAISDSDLFLAKFSTYMCLRTPLNLS